MSFDSAFLMELTAQLTEQMAVLRQMLDTSKQSLAAARTSAEMAHETIRQVTDRDDHVAAPKDMFGFREEQASVAAIQAAARNPASLAPPGPLPSSSQPSAPSSGLSDPWNKGPLHYLANKVDDAHAKAVTRLRRQMDYLQQSAEGLVSKLGRDGLPHVDAMRSLTRNGMVGAMAAMESAVSLERLYQDGRVKQVLAAEDQVMALKERAQEVRGMAVQVGEEARAAARAVRYGKQVPSA